MNKVKTLAHSSRLINYQEVCEYTNQLPSMDGVPVDLQPQLNHKWSECLQFLRNNPKIML